MCDILRKSLYVFFLLLILSTGYGQWNPVNKNLDGAYVVALTKLGEKVFAATSGGVFFSDNNGVSWNAIDALFGYYPYSILGTDGALYVSFHNGANYKSTDNGATWTAIFAGSYIRKFVAMGTTVFALSIDGKLYKTSNTTTPTTLNTGLSGVSTIAIQGSTIFLGTNSSGMYSSNDLGITWNPISTGFSGNIVQIEAIEAMIVARILANGVITVIHSTDQGVSWKSSGFSSGILSLGAIDNQIFIGNSSSVYKSTDNGNNWNLFSDVPNGAGGIIANTSDYYFGSATGVYRSVDAGVSWSESIAGLAARSIKKIVSLDNSLFAISSNRIYKSDNNGSDWYILYSVNPTDAFYSLTVSDTNIMAGTFSSGVHVSSDKGTTWTLADGLSGAKSFAQFGTKLFAGNTFGIFVSDDSGVSWSPFSTIQGVIAIGGAGDFLFASYLSGTVLRFSLDATSIVAQLGIPSSDQVTSFTFNNSHFFCGTSNNGVFRTTDNGLTWSAVNNGFTGELGITSLLVKNNELFATRTKQGIFYSNDNATSWLSYNIGMPDGILTNSVNALYLFGNKLYAATNANGIWSTCLIQDKPTVTVDLTNPLEAVLTSSNAAGYQWYFNGTSISGANQNKLTATIPGNYAVTAITVDGCVSPKSDEASIIITGDISDKVDMNSLYVYPNPASQFIVLDLTNYKNEIPIVLTIVDSKGHHVFQSISNGGERFQLPLSNYSSGVYSISISQGSNSKWGRFIKISD